MRIQLIGPTNKLIVNYPDGPTPAVIIARGRVFVKGSRTELYFEQGGWDIIQDQLIVDEEVFKP